MPAQANQEQVKQVWRVKRKNPNWSQRQIAEYCNIGRRTVQRYLDKRWLEERGLSGLIGEEPEASNGDREVEHETPDTQQSTGAVLERESERRAEGIIPKRQPVDRISPQELRVWVDGHLDDLAQLIRNLKSRLPGPRPALNPDDVWVLVKPEGLNDRLPILEKQLRSYTRRNPMWTRMSTSERTVSKLRKRVDQLFAKVTQEVEAALKSSSVDPSLHENLRQNFTSLLFYHAVAVALGEKGFHHEHSSWSERLTLGGQIELGRGRGWELPPVPPAAKSDVKEVFDRLVEEVSDIRLVTEVRASFDLHREQRRDIREALDNLLVV